MDPEPVSLSTMKELAGGASLIIGGLYAILRFIFEPRLHRTIDEKVGKKLTPLEERMVRVELAEARTSTAVHQVGEDVKRITALVEKISEQSLEQGKSLAFIEGTMRSRAPRIPFDDQHHQ